MSFESPIPNKEKEESVKDKLVARLGGELHEEWKKGWRATHGDEPRMKKTKDSNWISRHKGAVELDIASTDYKDLPNEWQHENKASAEIAVEQTMKAVEAGEDLDEAFIERASSVLHDKWLERNGSWAPAEQKLPYSELSEEEKEKDRVIIRSAVNLVK
ncbi:MAG: hypothetical protein WCK01_00660 [Candidatus Uhrbacteria bacterium]